MPSPSIRQILYRLAVTFAVTFVVLTALLLATFAVRQLTALSSGGASPGTVIEALLLAVPFTAALTIPMAVFVAVLRVFKRLGAEGTLAAARREPAGVRRLVRPVLGAAAAITALTLALNTQVVPRANERLAQVLASGTPRNSDRTMTVGELRAAVLDARADTGSDALARAAAYEVEIQKKYALAAACLVLAFAGMAITLRFPRGGAALLVGTSLAAFTAYYLCIVAGESLADRLLISPFIAMWLANALLLAAALLVMWRSRGFGRPRGNDLLALGA
jgi:lipopolysaccharide export LptBFGC system permease protein LptF